MQITEALVDLDEREPVGVRWCAHFPILVWMFTFAVLQGQERVEEIDRLSW